MSAKERNQKMSQDPLARRERMQQEIRRSKNKQIIAQRRENMNMNQTTNHFA